MRRPRCSSIVLSFGYHGPMPRYAAFLRGVSPMNAKMPELAHAFESAGFTSVKTLLSSGNVVFDTRSATNEALQRKAEAAMEKELGHGFLTIVRPVAFLRALVETDPYGKLPPDSKQIVTFL